MKRMLPYLFILIAGFLLGHWVASKRREVPSDPQPVNAWQESIRIERVRPETPDDAKARLMEKLRESERRQRPEEGRN
ncbi:MAG: hypothetical protein Q8M02_13235 [Candidatus Didemnitutus sp.]|nr:hypothetical protein [Candidatus Didemnitutus sp.]